MRVIVREEALRGRAERALDLVALFSQASRRRHDVLVSADAAEAWGAWLSTRSELERQVFQQAVHSSDGRQALSPSEVEVEVADPDDSEWAAEPPLLHATDALALMECPFEILVEDETSDGAFLDAVVPPPLRDGWRAARTTDRVRLASLGGLPQVRRRLAGDRADPPRSERSFVLLDSDAPAPWLDPTAGRSREESWRRLPAATRDAAHAARSARIPVYVLARRMAENHLPAAALRSWLDALPVSHQVGKRDHVDAFVELPPERRHHHNLKRGLHRDELPLYGELSPEARESLGFSLGNTLWQAFDHAREADLQDDGVHAELASLFRQILRRI